MSRSFYIRNRPIKEEHYDIQTFGMKDLQTIYQEKKDRELMKQMIREHAVICAKSYTTTIRLYIIDLQKGVVGRTIDGLKKTIQICMKEYNEDVDGWDHDGVLGEFERKNIWNTQVEQMKRMLRIGG